MSALCRECETRAEKILDQVMTGETPLSKVPASLAAWWLAGTNNAERIQPYLESMRREVERWWAAE